METTKTISKHEEFLQKFSNNHENKNEKPEKDEKPEKLDANKNVETKSSNEVKSVSNNDFSGETLGLYSDAIGNDELKRVSVVLQGLAKFTKILLWKNNITGPGMEHLSQALLLNSVITNIDLESNDIGDVGATALANALKSNGSSITSVNIGTNNIGAQGTKALSEALLVNYTLTEIDLRGNKVGVEGAEALSKVIEKNQTLTSLNLWTCQIEEKGALMLAAVLPSSKSLRLLEVWNNNIEQEGFAQLKKAAKTVAINSCLTFEYDHNLEIDFLNDKEFVEKHLKRCRCILTFLLPSTKIPLLLKMSSLSVSPSNSASLPVAPLEEIALVNFFASELYDFHVVPIIIQLAGLSDVE